MKNIKIIARIKTKFPEKFGVPRQSGIAKGTEGIIVFEDEFKNIDAVRGLEEFSHIWVLWEFSKKLKSDKEWSPTVRPPRLGGNKRVGVFATRSPNRPNSIGLSCLKIEKIEIESKNAPLIYVSGADMIDGTPIIDIKPYIPYVDCITDAKGSYTEISSRYKLSVEIPKEYEKKLGDEFCNNLKDILSNDPRPSYQSDDRVYGMKYDGYEVKFKVAGLDLSVIEINENPTE